ncbi:MAG TPA: GntR family transcriptional regulator [Thermodesulfovibrionales bacterium]|nr:GntR family transcriptional regulator [Thermodesulfovibrionales bacterium]
MELIDREDHQKLYFQLYEILRKKIEGNEWPICSQIPTEEDLCRMFNVSRATVRTAVMELVRQGYLKRQQGKGTFIFRNIGSEGLTMLTSLQEILFEKGFQVTTIVLERSVMMPIGDLDLKLRVPKDKHIIYIKRLRLIDNEPVLLQESYVPYHICPLLLEEDVENQLLFDIFEKKYGMKITRVENHIEIAYITSDEARIIGLAEGSPAILLNQYFYSGETLVMYTRSIKRTDRFKFLINLERKAA